MFSMRKTAAISAILAIVGASPLAHPQFVDFSSLVSSAGPPPSATIAIGVYSQVVSWDPASVAAAAAAEITSDPIMQYSSDSDTDYTSSGVELARRATTTACVTQPVGYGPKPTSDTASAFLAYKPFAAAASSAAVPQGYEQTFKNLHASNNAYGYMGFTTLKSYDVAGCAAQCNNIFGCSSFNIYFERDPIVDPGSGSNCLNPKSTTAIKCVFWGGPVNAGNAVNYGQYRKQFQVVIAGSNGYVNATTASSPGYIGPDYLGNSAINAPYDCNGDQTYMGFKFWNDGLPFDTERCAAACTAQSNYNIANPPATGDPMTCKFFNTYLLVKNGITQGQTCAMYNQTWADSYATNSGYTDGSDKYTIAYSYTYSNATDAGTCVKQYRKRSVISGRGVVDVWADGLKFAVTGHN